jgi:Cu(I)/Ag(I) efflux system membrane protein CusA/SilA
MSFLNPLNLLLIFVILYLAFHSSTQALLVIATLPVALAGSLWFIYLLEYPLSIAVIVGMIALAGVAAEFAVVMLIYLNQAVKNEQSLIDAVKNGAVMRVRPKAMTVLTIIFGLLPIMIGSGTGSEVMQKIAAPMLGGMIISPLVSMLVIPCAYYLLYKHKR